MLTIANDQLAIICDVSGHGLAIVDQKRGTHWALDENTLIFGESNDLTQRMILTPTAAKAADHAHLIVTYKAGESELAVHYVLLEDCVEVRLPQPTPENISFVSLPGSFTPAGEPHKLLLPIMQGMLWDGRGPACDVIRGEGSHLGFTMAFAGCLAETGGLLQVAETRDDARWWYGKDPSGRIWATSLQINSLEMLRYDRVVRIFPTDADIVAIAKRYRKYVQDAGRFISWEEKLARRPNLERLFGALQCFIGYCQDDGLDYVASFRKLRDYGFDRVLAYPGRFNVYDPDIRMGGQPPINLSGDDTAAIKALGYDVAPWSWLNEALDDGTPQTQALFRRNPAGEIMPHWGIDKQQWYHVCYSFIEAYQRDALRNTISDMTWDHFDVLACVPPQECYARNHPQHLGRPMPRSEERDYIRKTFLADAEQGMPVSSENFNDAYSLEYDIGSVRAWPQYGPWPFWPVPLTMLVYHDSLLHTWWEVHAYNDPYFGRTRATHPWFEYGGGRPRLMAASDALMGCPPQVFPFGAQYGWTGRGTETFLYKYRVSDPEVQIALREALPVTQLHRRIGKLEMVHFKFMSDDGYVQETAFSDGTHVVANFSRDVIGAEKGIGHTVIKGSESLMPESWKVVA